jgi:hypothetical protein
MGRGYCMEKSNLNVVEGMCYFSALFCLGIMILGMGGMTAVVLGFTTLGLSVLVLIFVTQMVVIEEIAHLDGTTRGAK